MTGHPIPMSGQDIVIPDKSAFKASDVCEIARIQPYVLRSWENEFPELGVSRTPGGPRVYRKTDVERVLQIRHLVLAEGLTLAGVRRKLSEFRGQEVLLIFVNPKCGFCTKMADDLAALPLEVAHVLPERIRIWPGIRII